MLSLVAPRSPPTPFTLITRPPCNSSGDIRESRASSFVQITRHVKHRRQSVRDERHHADASVYGVVEPFLLLGVRPIHVVPRRAAHAFADSLRALGHPQAEAVPAAQS